MGSRAHARGDERVLKGACEAVQRCLPEEARDSGDQVGLHSIPGPHKRAPEEREQYYGHADESIADIVKADAAASELSPRDPADEGWWAGTKNTVKGAVGGTFLPSTPPRAVLRF